MYGYRQTSYHTLLIYLLLCIATSAAAVSESPDSATSEAILQFEGVIIDAAGIPLEGPQDVELRFFSDEQATRPLLQTYLSTRAPTHILPDPVLFEHGRFQTELRAENSVDGSAPGIFESPGEVFHWTPHPWLLVRIDGAFESSRFPVELSNNEITVRDSSGSVDQQLDLQPIPSEVPSIEEPELELDKTHDDPSHHRDYSGSCVWRTTCNSTRMQIRWPSTGTCFANAVPDLPLAVLLRGRGFNYRDYDYLQNHLRANGILSVSLDLVANQETPLAHQTIADRAEQILGGSCFESFLDRFATEEPVDFHRTAIIGHSRGGETARYLADNFYFNPEFTTKSVVALAPTDATSKPLFGYQSPSYMLLYGSSDTDVSPSVAFGAHDLAGWNEISTPTSFDLERSMKLLAGGTHFGFTDLDSNINPQRLITKGYVHAFLRRWLRGDSRFYGFITRDLTPGASSRTFSQFSSGSSRRVIDNFQRSQLNPNSVGGSLFTFGMGNNLIVDPTTLADTPHSGRVFNVRPAWNGAYIGWTLPEGVRNARPFRYLSFRIGLQNDDLPSRVLLWILNDGEYSAVDLADFGEVSEPINMCLEGTPTFCHLSAEQGHMKTFRVPLVQLGAHDDIRAVFLQFLDGSVGKDFLIDNLEFAEPSVTIGF